MILAERDLLRKVWKKAAMPICEMDHPTAMMTRRRGEVVVKKLVWRTKAPKRKNIMLVIMERRKLKMK